MRAPVSCAPPPRLSGPQAYHTAPSSRSSPSHRIRRLGMRLDREVVSRDGKIRTDAATGLRHILLDNAVASFKYHALGIGEAIRPQVYNRLGKILLKQQSSTFRQNHCDTSGRSFLVFVEHILAGLKHRRDTVVQWKEVFNAFSSDRCRFLLVS